MIKMSWLFTVIERTNLYMIQHIDYVYMDTNYLIIVFILNKTTL